MITCTLHDMRTTMLDMLQRHKLNVLLAHKLLHTPSPASARLAAWQWTGNKGAPHRQHGVGLNPGQVFPVFRAL